MVRDDTHDGKGWVTRVLNLQRPDVILDVASVALGEQVRVLAKGRLGRRRGALSDEAMGRLDRALLVALDLPGAIDS